MALINTAQVFYSDRTKLDAAAEIMTDEDMTFTVVDCQNGKFRLDVIDNEDGEIIHKGFPIN